MSEYRNAAKEVHRDSWWTLRRFLPITLAVLGLCAATGLVLFGVCSVGSTAIEREVFEHSYQRSEGFKARIATDEAALAEIERKLQNPHLDADTRANLEAQVSAIRVRLDAARRQQ